MKRRLFGKSIGLLVGVAVLGTSILLPTRRVEAGGEAVAAGLIGGMAGLMLGVGLEHSNHSRRQCQARKVSQRQWNQKMIMRNVLARYQPAYHDRWVEYVIVDLQGYLAPAQQEQLLYALEQKRRSIGNLAGGYESPQVWR